MSLSSFARPALRSWELDPELMQKLIEYFGNKAFKTKNDSKGKTISIPSFCENHETGFLIYSLGKSLMIVADKESAATLMGIIDQYDTDEAMKRISELGIDNVP